MLGVNYGLAADGLCRKNGMAKSLLTLALVYEMGESYLPGLPLAVQRGIFKILARIAYRKGVHKQREKYYVGTIEPKINRIRSKELAVR